MTEALQRPPSDLANTLLHDLSGPPSRFLRASQKLSDWSGRSTTFALACALVLLWVVTGPLFHYSDTWQLVINTSTTIITFLMVFLLQATQNRDTRALQIKLDELIRATSGAHNALLSLEDLGEAELAVFQKRYAELAERAKKALDEGLQDTDAPPLESTAKAGATTPST
ncbi:low affinity iron permease family protein [Niveibacterium sp. SC-1]|uniref:low affinity iron permease family protein n=1 Tax=Niveibacterium sp. SC-1 TaxID=3135646 RepID=UPI00311D7C16